MTYILQQVVKQSLGCDLYYQNTVDDRSDYPFVTYNFIMPEQDTTGDWLGQGRQYETHLQIDCHATSTLKSMNMADTLFTALHEIQYQAYFEQAGIEPEQIENTSDRTVIAGSFYDYRFGFDCSFFSLQRWTCLQARRTRLHSYPRHRYQTCTNKRHWRSKRRQCR